MTQTKSNYLYKTLFDLRGYYNTSMQYLLIIPLIWAIFFSAAPITWWIVCLFMAFMLNVYGFGIGFHHTFSHKTFKFNRYIEILIMYLGTCATLTSPLSWAIAHDSHHRYVDKDGDPHSPSILGWKVLFFHNHKTKRPNFLTSRSLFKDKVHIWFDSHIGYWTVVLSLPIISFLLFGIYGLVFIWAIPTFYALLTGVVFALAHSGEINEYGHRAKNSWILNLFSFGDGNHKLHHSNWSYTGKFHEWCALLVGKKNST